MLRALLIFLRIVLIVYALVVLALLLFQRSLIYFPTHHDRTGALQPWWKDGKLIGYCREVPNPTSVWLVAHGNAGQAADRDYMLHCFPPDASVYVVEYPGYGSREGHPSAASLNEAVSEAYAQLTQRFPHLGVGVVGESIGSGPACLLARQSPPPRKIVLLVPFDTFANIAAGHFPFLPIRLILKDRWDNVEALQGYRGPVEIYAAADDTVIPPHHARHLSEAVSAKFTLLPGGHNDWANSDVAIRMPALTAPQP